MFLRKVIYLGLFFFIIACSKQEEPLYKPTAKVDPFKVYEEGLNAFEKNDFFLPKPLLLHDLISSKYEL